MSATTEQEWIRRANTLLSAARQAVTLADKVKMREAAEACLQFVSTQTLTCPRECADSVSRAQVELSQLIIKDDVVAIVNRTPEFDGFLEKISALTKKADAASELISLQSAKQMAEDVSGLLLQLKNVRAELNAGRSEAAVERVQAAILGLEKLQQSFAALKNDATNAVQDIR